VIACCPVRARLCECLAGGSSRPSIERRAGNTQIAGNLRRWLPVETPRIRRLRVAQNVANKATSRAGSPGGLFAHQDDEDRSAPRSGDQQCDDRPACGLWLPFEVSVADEVDSLSASVCSGTFYARASDLILIVSGRRSAAPCSILSSISESTSQDSLTPAAAKNSTSPLEINGNRK
jgi:hypothetical protein